MEWMIGIWIMLALIVLLICRILYLEDRIEELKEKMELIKCLSIK